VAPDGSRNRIFIQRLKDKLGNRSNASSEIEYDDTFALRVGDEGRGVRTIIDMVHHTRLDAAVAPAGLMRQALSQALHHAEHRRAFGRRLVEQPLMRNVLADLALEVEAAVALGLRVARSFDEGPHDAQAAAFARLATAVTKYWLNKRVIGHVAEALECLGGAGFVEESSLPRMYREAPLNGIWEGSANVICLDVLRVFARSPEAVGAIESEVGATNDPRIARRLGAALRALRDPAVAESQARAILESLALCVQASLMKRYSDARAAEAFCASRLDGDSRAFGALELDAGALGALAARGRLER
jgi:putative acyl-CoA dehydrogenase